ncbi:MAG: hypothetical protein ACE5F9_04310 [Phycisphaerae bacterium]
MNAEQHPATDQRPADAHATRSPAGDTRDSPTDDELLIQILEELRAIRREQQHREFSFWHLAGAVAQAFAVCAVAWAIYAAINDDNTAATIRFLAAIVFQTLALTGFAAPKNT